MKKLLVFLGMIVCINSANAENFKTMLRNNGITFQIDVDSIKKHGQYHHVIVAQKYSSTKNENSVKYNEIRSNFILDCSSNREYIARLSRYLNGKMVWESSNPEGFKLEKDDSGMIEYICQNEITN